jgi:hypothetical protein
LIDLSAFGAISNLFAFDLAIESDRPRKMEAYQFVRREMEGTGTEIGWECTPAGEGETDTSWLAGIGLR